MQIINMAKNSTQKLIEKVKFSQQNIIKVEENRFLEDK